MVFPGSLAAALYFVEVNFSVAASTCYECTGNIGSKECRQRTTVYFRLEEYRWWLHLWSESDGNLWLELPKGSADYYSKIERLGEDLVNIQRTPSELSGSFSRPSQRLAIQTASEPLKAPARRKPGPRALCLGNL